MGWNTGFEIMEATVIGAARLGVLDRKLLGVLLKPYSGTDIDSGGRVGLRTRDGREIEQVVIEAAGRKMPKKPPGRRPPWDVASEAAREPWDRYDEQVYETFNKVTARYGW